MTNVEEQDLRRHKADRATRGVLAALLCLEAFVVLLIPRAIAQTSVGLSPAKTILLLVFAVVLVVVASQLRRTWGVAVGSLLQVLLLATVVFVPALIIVVVLFIGIWVYVLRTRHQLVGTPSGWRMMIS
jgi:hypothetical protein